MSNFPLLAEQLYSLSDGELPQEYNRASIRASSGGHNVTVSLRVVVDETGRVTSASAFYGPKSAYPEAEQAERQLRFRPFIRNGKAIRTSFIDDVTILPLEGWLMPRIEFPHIKDLSSLIMRMERRDRCFQPRCMYYTVEVNGKGLFRLSKGSFVFRNPKTFDGHISDTAIQSLLVQFQRADFFSLKQSYISTVTDCEGAILTISFDSEFKSTAEYCGRTEGLPEAVPRLEREFDRIAQTKRLLLQ